MRVEARMKKEGTSKTSKAVIVKKTPKKAVAKAKSKKSASKEYKEQKKQTTAGVKKTLTKKSPKQKITESSPKKDTAKKATAKKNSPKKTATQKIFSSNSGTKNKIKDSFKSTAEKINKAKKLVSAAVKKMKIPAKASKAKDSVKVKSKNSAPGLSSAAKVISVQQEKETIEKSKFDNIKQVVTKIATVSMPTYTLPVKYGDNRLVLLPRDPWWVYTYWEVTEHRINEVIRTIPVYERRDLRWILRIYDVTAVSNFNGSNANSYFDVEVNVDQGTWYINVKPERDWCLEIGLINPQGRFFAVLRSNVIKTPNFGVSSETDEEWFLPDEDYFKVLGMSISDIGKSGSSLQMKEKIEKRLKEQISSPLASWGGSGAFEEKKAEKDKFFLEVWTEVILYGRTHSDATVTVEGKKVSLRDDGTFSLRYALPEGDFKYGVVATSSNKKYRLKSTPAVKRYTKK